MTSNEVHCEINRLAARRDEALLLKNMKAKSWIPACAGTTKKVASRCAAAPLRRCAAAPLRRYARERDQNQYTGNPSSVMSSPMPASAG